MAKRLFGNLHNRLMENTKSTPKVGEGATLCYYSDREAATVVEIKTDRKVIIQEDTATRTDKNGQSECQDYAYTPNPNGAKHTVTLRKDGRWRVSKGTTGVRFGERDKYHDYGF